MTLRELKNEVNSLSFISPEEQGGLFFSSVKRALSMLFCQLKITKCLEYSIEPLPVVSSYTNLVHNGKETKTLPLSGRAYSIRLSGKGRIVIIDGGIIQTKEFNSDDILFRGFIEKGGTVRFEGDFSYKIVSFITFNDVKSERTEDIYSENEDYIIDMQEKNDFFSFLSVTDEKGLPIKNYSTSGTRLFLPKGYRGKVLITYRVRPIDLADCDESIIDIPKRFEPLLAPLVAAFTLADDNPELSEKYMMIYDNLLGCMNDTKEDLAPIWVRTNGWA